MAERKEIRTVLIEGGSRSATLIVLAALMEFETRDVRVEVLFLEEDPSWPGRLSRPAHFSLHLSYP